MTSRLVSRKPPLPPRPRAHRHAQPPVQGCQGTTTWGADDVRRHVRPEGRDSWAKGHAVPVCRPAAPRAAMHA